MSDIDLSRVHLIGIGGAGMSGVARILLSRGKVVSGSDVKESRPVLALQSMGAHVAVGHKAENLTLSGQLPSWWRRGNRTFRSFAAPTCLVSS